DADLKVICLEGDDLWIADMKKQFAAKADLFLTGNRDPLAASLDFENDPPAINNWKLGRYLGFVNVDPVEESGYTISGLNIPLEEDLADREDIMAVLDEFKGGLKDV